MNWINIVKGLGVKGLGKAAKIAKKVIPAAKKVFTKVDDVPRVNPYKYKVAETVKQVKPKDIKNVNKNISKYTPTPPAPKQSFINRGGAAVANTYRKLPKIIQYGAPAALAAVYGKDVWNALTNERGNTLTDEQLYKIIGDLAEPNTTTTASPTDTYFKEQITGTGTGTTSPPPNTGTGGGAGMAPYMPDPRYAPSGMSGNEQGTGMDAATAEAIARAAGSIDVNGATDAYVDEYGNLRNAFGAYADNLRGFGVAKGAGMRSTYNTLSDDSLRDAATAEAIARASYADIGRIGTDYAAQATKDISSVGAGGPNELTGLTPVTGDSYDIPGRIADTAQIAADYTLRDLNLTRDDLRYMSNMAKQMGPAYEAELNDNITMLIANKQFELEQNISNQQIADRREQKAYSEQRYLAQKAFEQQQYMAEREAVRRASETDAQRRYDYSSGMEDFNRQLYLNRQNYGQDLNLSQIGYNRDLYRDQMGISADSAAAAQDRQFAAAQSQREQANYEAEQAALNRMAGSNTAQAQYGRVEQARDAYRDASKEEIAYAQSLYPGLSAEESYIRYALGK